MNKITMKSQTNLSFDEAFERFIRKCEIKNLTQNTIKSYREGIRPFDEFCKISDIALADINGDTIDDFVLWLRKNHNVNDISVNTHLRSVRAFAYFAMDNGYIERFKVHIPKATKKMKKTYSEDELNILLKKPNTKECTFTDFKIWAFENFLLGTGVRISTALDVRIKDVDFDSGCIFLRRTKAECSSIYLWQRLWKLFYENIWILEVEKQTITCFVMLMVKKQIKERIRNQYSIIT